MAWITSFSPLLRTHLVKIAQVPPSPRIRQKAAQCLSRVNTRTDRICSGEFLNILPRKRTQIQVAAYTLVILQGPLQALMILIKSGMKFLNHLNCGLTLGTPALPWTVSWRMVSFILRMMNHTSGSLPDINSCPESWLAFIFFCIDCALPMYCFHLKSVGPFQERLLSNEQDGRGPY